MKSKYSISDGKALIHYARKNLEHYLSKNSYYPISEELKKKYGTQQGAFITLNKYQTSGNPLRGCIGLILPIKPLIKAVQEMSIAAALEDPRFNDVRLEELDKICIEISILSVPEKIEAKSPEDLMNQIKIGRDGLIINQGQSRGLLLPQVPIEHDRNWSVETFLEHTCNKAWLPFDAWKDLKKTTVKKFTATIFEEESPGGKIKQKKIGI